MISCSAAIVASLPVTGGTRIDAGRLERRDRAAAGAVVRGDDADDLRCRSADLAAGPFLRLGRRPVGRVELGQRLVAAGVEALVDAVADQARGRVGRRAVDLQHAAVVRGDALAFRCSTRLSAIALPMPSLSKET